MTSERPRVVVTASMSVDGRLALARDRLLMDEESSRGWYEVQPASAERVADARADQLRELYGPQAILNGSGSFVTGDGYAFGESVGASKRLYADFLPPEVVARPGREQWFTAVDGRGRVRWTMTSQGAAELLVLVAETTPSGYLEFLRQKRIPYLVVGRERVDLGAALRRMRERLEVTCVLADGGGGLNGALLRAGLVDELQLLVFPAAIGGSGVPSLFDGPELAEGESPTRLRLLAAEVEAGGMLWLRYEVRREGG